MKRFSEIFGLRLTQAELDFVDIIPGNDIPLYLDSYAFLSRNDIWSEAAHETLVSFFQEVLDAIRTKNKIKGVGLLSHLGEPEETHLGVSKDGNKGRGIGSIQASDLYRSLEKSKASETGQLSDLGDFALFIPGIGRDKISDITTNVIRKLLIEYTQEQCRLYGISVRKVASGFYWDINDKKWSQGYEELPVYGGRSILLVPKYSVRYHVGVDHSEYRRHFVLEFLKAEHLRADDSLVTTIRDEKTGKVKKKVVYKKDVDNYHPKTKDFLAEFSANHPEIIEQYRSRLRESTSRVPDINPESFDESLLASVLADRLNSIPPGSKCANQYHDFCLSVLSFIFFPNLIYPVKEQEINQGRKRIDIAYTNGKENGIFYRISLDSSIKANVISVECKNYTKEVVNPEVDQLVGRFDNARGRFGILMFRASDNPQKLIERCKDVARQGNGIVLPIDDGFILELLGVLVHGKPRSEIDMKVDRIYREVTS